MKRLLLLVAVLTMALGANAVPQSAEDMYEFMSARFAARNGEYSKALDLMSNVIDRHPDDMVLRFERAQIYLEAARIEKAIAELEAVTETDPDFYDAQRLLGRLLIDTSGGDRAKVERARGHLEEAFRIRPNDIGTGLAIVQIHLGVGRLKDAEEVLKELAEMAPDNRTINFQLSQLLARSGRSLEAREYLERVIRSEPTFGPAVFQLLEIYQTERAWSEAALALAPLAEADPLNLELQKRLGYIYVRAGEPDKAIKIFEDALKVDSSDERAQYLLAEALSDAGEFKKANVLYRRLLQRRPNDPELLISLGANQLSEADLTDAKSTFQTLADLEGVADQVSDIARTQLAAIDHQTRRYDAALENAIEVLEGAEGPNYQAISISLDIYRRRNDLGAAVDMLDSLLETYPDDAILEVRRMEYLIRARRAPEVNKVRDELVAEGDRGALAAVQAYVQAEVYGPAIKILEPLRDKSPEDINVLFQLGAAYERAGRFEDAELVFLALLELRPDHASTLNYLGYMWADRGTNLERAEKMLVEAVLQQPRNGAFVDSLGWAYYRLGRLEEAKKHLTNAASWLPRDPTIRFHLGDVYLALGLEQEALAEFQAALMNDPTVEDELSIRERLGQLEEKLGRK